MFCGVLQGSVHGPMLYTAELLQLIESHGPRSHLNAEDTQTYNFCAKNKSQSLFRVNYSACDDQAAIRTSVTLNCLDLGYATLSGIPGHLVQPLQVCDECYCHCQNDYSKSRYSTGPAYPAYELKSFIWICEPS